MRVYWAGLAVLVLALSACAPSDPNLMRLKATTDGPDEFGILPQKPLELPTNMTALPPPAIGGTNRADLNPMADAVIALGGRETASTGGVPSSDAGLYNYASRYGNTPGIRQTLADEDYEFRRKHPGRLLERIAGLTTYFQAYAKFSLDQEEELKKWRKRNVPTPSAPPSGEEQQNAQDAGY